LQSKESTPTTRQRVFYDIQSCDFSILGLPGMPVRGNLAAVAVAAQQALTRRR
jgi:hypothetical protein